MRKRSIIEGELLSVVKGLPEEKIAEVVDFAYYLKLREKIKEKELGNFDVWAEELAMRKGFSKLTEAEVAKLVMEYRSEAGART